MAMAARRSKSAGAACPAVGLPWPSSRPCSRAWSGIRPGDRRHGEVAGPSHVPARRLVLLDARHARAPSPFRSVRRPAPRLRVPHRQDPGPVPRRHRDVARRPRRPAADRARCPRSTAIHPMLRPGDVLVGDRGFCSFAHLALLAAAASTPSFACTRSRSSTSRPAADTPAPAQEGSRRACPDLGGSSSSGPPTRSSNGSSPADRPAG